MAVALEQLTAIKRAGRRLRPHLLRRRAGRDPRWLSSARGRYGRPLRAGPTGHPRRGQLAGALLPGGRRPSLFRRPGRGRLRLGRRRQPAARLRAVLRGVHPRPRPPRRREGGGRRRGRRHHLRRTDRGGGAAGRAHLRPGRGLRAGPPGVVGDRGGHDRRPGGAGLHRPQPGGQVRRVLSRPFGRAVGRGGSGVATLGLPDSAGVPLAAVAETVVGPYNTVPEVGEHVACVIVEPVAANMGLVPPGPGFLEGLRSACDAAGALLVFDEVITGFRLGPSGASGRTGVRPDLWCFGKVIGGGLPVGAVGGRADMLAVSPRRARLPGGHPVREPARHRGRARRPRGPRRRRPTRSSRPGSRLRRRARGRAQRRPRRPAPGDPGRPARGPGPRGRARIFGVFFAPAGAPPVRDYDGAAAAAATGLYGPFFHGLLRGGWPWPPGPTRWPSPRWPTARLSSTARSGGRGGAADLAG